MRLYNYTTMIIAYDSVDGQVLSVKVVEDLLEGGKELVSPIVKVQHTGILKTYSSQTNL